ncbi:hypothetical protein BT96DRAFT_995974 [Gymnopus androsaceus JB14]|uniref:Uncharacterized protein n=1 Tax=Gymnopus androsaceus JB14 TaxID=1447944 RepID=A0A6A4HJH3_9AGAR|nr:hypothetical protein BT96DRAFT_995974 [Gymnopus androsaceus JB14]
MDLPPYSALPDSVTLDPIPLSELQEIPYRINDNSVVPNSKLDPLDVLHILKSSFIFPEWQIFRAAMIHDSALIVGSSALAAIGVVDASAPSRLDILVGCDHSKALHTALCNSG